MRELDGNLTWNDEDIDMTSYTDEDAWKDSDNANYLDDAPVSDSPDMTADPDTDEQEADTQDIFSARRATKLLLAKYPDAFSYDPKSMRLCQFLNPDKGLTEFGWLYLQMLAYSVSGKHYRYEDQASLNTLAVSDCAEWLDKKVRHFKGAIANLRAILYTRMRNTMSNNLYKDNRYLPTEDIVLDRNQSRADILLTEEDIDPVLLDYSFRDVKEAHILTVKLWDLSRGQRTPKRRAWLKYRLSCGLSLTGVIPRDSRTDTDDENTCCDDNDE